MQRIQRPIADFLDGRRGLPPVVVPTEPVSTVVEIMRAGASDCVLVLDDGRLAGIFTERDLLNRVLAPGLAPRATAIGDVMTPAPESLRPRDRVAFAINRMAVGGFRNVPLVDEDHHPVGLLTVRDVIARLSELFRELDGGRKAPAEDDWVDLGGADERRSPARSRGAPMITLAELGATPLEKVLRREPVRLPPSASLGTAVARMREMRRGAVIVEDESGALAGILTEQDLLRRVDHDAPGWRDRTVGDVMTRGPVTVLGSASIAAALGLMKSGTFRHLPLVDADGRALGIVSIRDLLTYFAEHFPEEFVNLPPEPDLAASKLYGG